MNFGKALEALKDGKKVSRKGWNGKGMYLFLVSVLSYETKAEVDSTSAHQSIAMRTADSSVVIGWLASQTDMLAEDWIVLE